MNDELREIEDKLERLAPATMPEDMLARMEQAMERWQHFVPVEEKIVEFQPVYSEKKALKFFNVWASAAAVVLIAATSLMMFSGENDSIEANVAQLESVQPTENISKVVPASHAQFQTQMTDVSSDRITYDANGRPMRVTELGFEDEVMVRDRNGKVYKVKQPRVEYYAVPVEVY